MFQPDDFLALMMVIVIIKVRYYVSTATRAEWYRSRVNPTYRTVGRT